MRWIGADLSLCLFRPLLSFALNGRQQRVEQEQQRRAIAEITAVLEDEGWNEEGEGAVGCVH